MTNSSDQSVVYRFNATLEPAWQYYSMPESAVGGGTTLDDARVHYRDALKFSLETDDLPTIHEYVEREIGDSGIWLRLPIEHPSFDVALEQAGTQIAMHPDDRGWYFANTTGGGDPVVLNVPNDTPLRDVLGQMTIYDTLILWMLYNSPDGTLKNAWLALSGAETAPDDQPLIGFGEMGLTADSPMSDLLKAAVEHRVNRISALVPC
ncbi:MAG: hypothetical protein P4L86_13090 [Mycobacterium sp.]|nr:hypothetical protein [Mycobacterium sp.]